MARKGSKDRGLFERPRGSGIWWICYFDREGQQHREKVGLKGLARRVYEKRKTEIREQRFFPPERRRVVLFDEILEDYRAAARASGRVILRGESGYQRLRQAFGGRRADGITPGEIERFRDALAQTASAATVNRHLTLLRAIFRRAVRDGKLEAPPMQAVQFLKENNARVRYLTPDEEERLLGSLPERLRPLIIVAIHTGMRRGELLRLRWEDVDFFSGTITVRQAKSGEGRRLPMNRAVREILWNLRQQRIREGKAKGDGRELLSPYVFCTPGGGYLFNLDRDWYRAIRQAGIQDFRFHDFRHTFASRMVMAGVDLYSVQTLLGHKTPAMTLRYAHLSPGHLRQAVEVLAPETPYVSGASFGPSSPVNLRVSE